MSNTTLNFTSYLNAYGAEFPQCCVSGYWMVYNTHLRDPSKPLISNRLQIKKQKAVRALRKALGQAKKSSKQ